MSARKQTDAAILAGIAEATAAWNAEQDTAYYAQKFGYSIGAMLVILKRLEAAGQLARSDCRVWGGIVSKWRIK